MFRRKRRAVGVDHGRPGAGVVYLAAIMSDRRQHVRVRPTADYDVGAEYTEGIVTVEIQVTDIGVHGMGLLVDPLFADRDVGDVLELRIKLPDFPAFVAPAELRHTTKVAGSKCGMLLTLTDDQSSALRHAVGELQERGQSV
jgi:hypothetical protein